MLQVNEATTRFVREHAGQDVRRLALLAARFPGVDMPFALDQIAGRETARRKLPSWASVDGVVFPPHLSLEQCSSEHTARYKASLLAGKSLVDLTGGMGVDCFFMAQSFSNAIYVERQQHLCSIAEHNFHLLHCDNIRVVNGDSTQYLLEMPSADVIYLDPARRDNAGRRTYGIADCTPDVTALADVLLSKAPVVMVKLSPMLDVSQTLSTLPSVSDVHIVSTSGECKELLVIMRRNHTGATAIHCVNDDSVFTFNHESTQPTVRLWDGQWHEGLLLLEPNPSVMKAGCFNHVAAHYNLQVVSHDSHLFISDKVADGFSGRTFIIDSVTSMNKAELRHTLATLQRANVAVRNFPLRAADLARRLRLKDGGDTYIFGTTTSTGKHLLLLCHKRH